MTFSTEMKERVLDRYFTNNKMYIALFNGSPTDNTNEVDKSEYVRKEVLFDNASNNNETVTTKNSEKVEFNVSGSSWGEITHVAVFDALSNGNLLDYAELNVPVQVNKNTQFWMDSGDYKIEW